MTGNLIKRLREQAYFADRSAEDAFNEAAGRIEALEAENERLRGALEVVWKEATTMRNASKLVGPYAVVGWLFWVWTYQLAGVPHG